MTDVPHFRVPFNFGRNNHADVIEQDSTDDVKQCVEAVLRTPLGSRLEVTDYGIEDQNFKENGPDERSLRRVIDRWEPRADYDITIIPNPADPQDWTIQVEIQGSDDA